MNLVTVIPISKGIFKEELTYFSARKIEIGMLVTVPVRSSKVHAVVISVEPLTHAKTSLKNSAFTLKKIESVASEAFFSHEVFSVARKAGKYFISETGRALNQILPAAFLNNHENLATPTHKARVKTGIKNETLVFQASKEDRITAYKTYIRAAFAQKQSVFVCVPTKEDADILGEILSKGIDNYVYTIHNGLSENEIIKKTNALLKEDHAVVIVATGSFLSIPRHDIETIIIENESSSIYKNVARPFVDFRIIAEMLSTELGIKLILGDTLVRIETRGRLENHECSEFSPLSYRVPKTPPITLIEKNKDDQKSKTWNVFEPETEKLIQEYSGRNKNILILALKKGYSGSIVCRDCGHTMICKSCSSKLELHDSKTGERFLVCSECKKKENPNTVCPKCSGWNLMPLGIGADRISEALLQNLPKNKIFQIDAINTSTPVRAKKVYEKYLETKGGILITTEAGYRKNKIQSSASIVLSTDALLNMSSFKNGERYIQLVRDLKDTTEENIIIETKEISNPVILALSEGQISEWTRNEDSLRKRFGYPPYTNIIKVNWRQKKSDSSVIEKLESVFKEYEHYFIGTNYSGSLILKTKREHWASPILSGIGKFDNELYEKLMSLPINMEVEVDAE